MTKCRWGSADKEDFTEKVTSEAKRKGEGGTGRFRQREEYNEVWRETIHGIFSNGKYFSKLLYRHREKGWQEMRLQRKTGISSGETRHQADKFGFYF